MAIGVYMFWEDRQEWPYGAAILLSFFDSIDWWQWKFIGTVNFGFSETLGTNKFVLYNQYLFSSVEYNKENNYEK